MQTTPATSEHGSLQSYIIGFLLSITLTIIPFLMIRYHLFSATTIVVVLTLFAIAQLIVQLVFFLHLNTRQHQRWHLMAFLFTLLIIAILLIGAIWIMHHLDINMMSDFM